jgi:hypothetical protein
MKNPIYDKNGWCNDLSFLDWNDPNKLYHLYVKSKNTSEGWETITYLWVAQQKNCADIDIIAWKPLGKPPISELN